VGTHCFSSLNFEWTFSPPPRCAFVVSMFFPCLCVYNLVFFVHTFACFLGPKSFAPFLLFLVCKGGNTVVEVRAPSPKFLQAQASNEHPYPMFVSFLCPYSSYVCVCVVLCFMHAFTFFWALGVLLPLFYFLFVRVGMWWLK
jgi:hypothetical protein